MPEVYSDTITYRDNMTSEEFFEAIDEMTEEDSDWKTKDVAAQGSSLGDR